MKLRDAFVDVLLAAALVAFIAGNDRVALLAVIFAAAEMSISHGRGLLAWTWGKNA